MDFPFHGIPTVPPRKDMGHMVGRGRGGGALARGRARAPTLARPRRFSAGAPGTG